VISIISPLNHRCAPGKASAEDDEQDQIAALHAAGGNGFVQRDADGGCGGVAELMHVHKKLFGLRAQSLADGVNDAAVRLVRDD